MKREGRWDRQKDLVKRIAKITTRTLPADEGVALRFINQEPENSLATNLTLARIGAILNETSWHSSGGTRIGTCLRSRILQPMVYDKLDSNSLERPILISIITDGAPTEEPMDTLAKEILKCGNLLEERGYPRKSVKFMVGQVGTATAAARFMGSLRSDTDIADVVYCTSDQLDVKFKEFRENEWNLDQWSI